MSKREADLADVFVTLAASVTASSDVIDTMDSLVQAGVTFTSAVEAGIVLADEKGVLHIVASTSERAADVEEAQLGSASGPCFDAFTTGTTVESPDLVLVEEKWPEFAGLARARGFRAAHAVPLTLRGDVLGSLNLFSDHVGPLSDNDVALAQALANAATISLLQQRALHKQTSLAEQLQHALTSRIVIEQAKGVLAERHKVPLETAFDLLRAHARRHGARITETARRIIDRPA